MKQFVIMMLMIILGACTATPIKEVKAREDNLPKPKLIMTKTLGQ